MNTTTRNRKSSIVRRALPGLLTGILLAPLTMAAGAGGSFQHKVLFNPTPAQLKVEARGRVMIYDGLDNADVERAMDEQFGRLEHMMFVRTHHAGPDGDYSYNDDGCD